MQITIYHQDIEQHLSKELANANVSVKIAVAWFTNKRLFGLLLDKLVKGVAIELIILNDTINFSQGRIDFQEFIQRGGSLRISAEGKKLHHKFCIIDDNVICTGSYNWTYHAENENYENLVVSTGIDHLTTALSGAFNLVRAGSFEIENLIRFHEMYPPRSAQQDVQSYSADDDALECIDYHLDLDSFRRIRLEHTSPRIKAELEIAFEQSLSVPVRAAMSDRSHLLRSLVIRFHDWSVDELRQYHSYFDNELLIENKNVCWNAEKLEAASFTASQLSKVFQVSTIGPLAEIVTRYHDHLDWVALSKNPTAYWTVQILEDYADRLDWNWFDMENKSLFWTKALIEKFKLRINWKVLSSKRNVEWSEDLIHEFEGNLDFGILSNNDAVPWTPSLFANYRHRLNFAFLSANSNFCWTEKLVIDNESKWDWALLFKNEGMCWNETLIRRYHQKYYKSILLENKGIAWTSEMLEGLSEWLDASSINYINGWGALSIVNAKWKTPEILCRFEKKFYIGYICSNTYLDWQGILSTQLAERIMSHWHLPNTVNVGILALVSNTSFPWSDDLIERHAKVIDGNKELVSGLVRNIGFVKTKHFINRYADSINFRELSNQKEVQWSLDLLECYCDKWDWNWLSGNVALPWSDDLIDESKLYWERILENEAFYRGVLKPMLNPIILDRIITSCT